MRRFIILAASWFGTGFSPVASGTVGTVAAIPFYLLLARLPLSLYLVTLVTFCWMSCWVSGQAEVIFQEKDSGKIVIDEVVGYLVTMTAVAGFLERGRVGVPPVSLFRHHQDSACPFL